MSINGKVLGVREIESYEDNSKSYGVVVLGHPEEVTLRAFDNERIPAKGDDVLISIGVGELSNHAMGLTYGMPT